MSLQLCHTGYTWDRLTADNIVLQPREWVAATLAVINSVRPLLPSLDAALQRKVR